MLLIARNLLSASLVLGVYIDMLKSLKALLRSDVERKLEQGVVVIGQRRQSLHALICGLGYSCRCTPVSRRNLVRLLGA